MRGPATPAIGLLGLLMLGLVGCQRPEVQQDRTVAVPSGTPVQLVLLSTLTSGGSSEGDPVRMMVLKDVVVDGVSVVQAGTLVEGSVSRSRGATAVTALINQPARLEATLGSVGTVDSQKLELSGSPDQPAQPYSFTLDGSEDIPSGRVSTLTPEERDALSLMVRELLGPEPETVLEDDARRGQLQSMAESAGLGNLERSLEEVDAGKQDLVTALKALRAGTAPSLVGPELALALTAVSELGNLTRSVDRGLRGIFRGRNIEAGEGMLIQAYIGAPATVTVPQPSTR